MHLPRLVFVLLLASAMTWVSPSVAPAQGAAAPYDFPERMFHGGNADWNILIERQARGEVVFVLDHDVEPEPVIGTLASVDPDQTVDGMHARHALEGTVRIHGQDRDMKVLLAPAPEGQPCRDRHRRAFPFAIMAFIRGSADGARRARVLYGCGKFLPRAARGR